MLITDFWDLSHTAAAPLLHTCPYPWEALAHLREWILSYGDGLDRESYHHPLEGVWIAKSAKVAPSAVIKGPAIIGEESEVRQGAFLRGGTVVGEGCVVGNSTELKGCILFDGVQVPHFNYVGDSILGYKAHLGAGAVTSNVKGDRSPVTVQWGTHCHPTGLRKLGALVGDFAEIGFHAVLSPGAVLGRRSTVYPLSHVRGYVPPDSILKGERGIFSKRK